MFTALIKKENQITNYSEFKTLPEAEAWIADNYDYFPSGFVAEIIDVSAIKRKEKRIARGKARIEMGAQIIAEIVAINEERLELGVLTDEEFMAMLNDPILFKIERLLWNGSLESAKSMIQAMPETYFNSVQINYILDMINNFLLAEAQQ